MGSPRKSQVAIVFLRNTGRDPLEKRLVFPPYLKITSGYMFLRNTVTDHPREAIEPLGSNCFSGEVRGPSVKSVDD